VREHWSQARLYSDLDLMIRARTDERQSIRVRRATDKRAAPPKRQHRIQPPPRSRTRPNADSWMGQNCGGHRRARLADRHRHVNVCLVQNLLQATTGHAADFGTDVLPVYGISPFSVSKRIKQTFSCHLLCVRPAAENFAVAAPYRHPRAAASGKHPIRGSGDHPTSTFSNAIGAAVVSKSWQRRDDLITSRPDSGRR
jgi:hypothetical protein